ncbi:MAG: hypothetical protein COU31_02925 [Candidatus Magasanikbacteria bacterium CG10_big_fil_rev_8_21_14_0_10_40_10]|uniref:Uncharacterized protein n=1 Tax=Candidatus Magasanikbacteria bacterium CG10_big_fil_rev_8_21_14_0_10_40_10 TaxID=1974648 RepID=A0A2M6W3P8_9BACT|nr:MAG: hypothetical protein COU31_02925 [Candidatus Magasanikbacteria bacterium CG10_big_fil_rev_8_21_14_0_10_40_10]
MSESLSGKPEIFKEEDKVQIEGREVSFFRQGYGQEAVPKLDEKILSTHLPADKQEHVQELFTLFLNEAKDFLSKPCVGVDYANSKDQKQWLDALKEIRPEIHSLLENSALRLNKIQIIFTWLSSLDEAGFFGEESREYFEELYNKQENLSDYGSKDLLDRFHIVQDIKNALISFLTGLQATQIARTASQIKKEHA